MGPITKAQQLPKLSPMKSKLRVTLSYLTHKVFVKVSKRSVVDMAFKPTSKVAGLCESVKKICGRYGIQTHFKGGSTIKNFLVSPK